MCHDFTAMCFRIAGVDHILSGGAELGYGVKAAGQ
jgi:hypothetical protein